MPRALVRRRKLVQRKKLHKRVKRDLGQGSSRSRSKRQASLGYPSKTMWEEIVPHLPKYGRHYYAPVGSTVSLKCYAGHGSESEQDRVDDVTRHFDWMFANGMPVTAMMVTLDKGKGDLTFHSVRLADTGIYNCTMKTGGDGEDGTGRELGTWQSQLDVVAGPVYWVRFGMTYTTDRCRHKELLLIQRSIPDIVHQYVCHFCSVRNVSAVCMNYGEGKIVQLTLAMSALGFEEMISGWNHIYVYCDLECQKMIHAKVLEIMAQSLVKLFSLQS